MAEGDICRGLRGTFVRACGGHLSGGKGFFQAESATFVNYNTEHLFGPIDLDIEHIKGLNPCRLFGMNCLHEKIMQGRINIKIQAKIGTRRQVNTIFLLHTTFPIFALRWVLAILLIPLKFSTSYPSVLHIFR